MVHIKRIVQMLLKSGSYGTLIALSLNQFSFCNRKVQHLLDDTTRIRIQRLSLQSTISVSLHLLSISSWGGLPLFVSEENLQLKLTKIFLILMLLTFRGLYFIPILSGSYLELVKIS